MIKRPTMPDVALAAGVSLKTVSRVVNEEDGVRPATAAKVMAAIDALGYRRNELARGLRGGSSSTVGVVVTDVGNPFFSRLARTIEQSVGDRLMLLASSGENPARERQLVGRLAERSVDGLMIVPAAQDQSYVDDLDAGDLPVVFMDRRPLHRRHDVVMLDNRWGASQAVSNLAALGSRRIAMVGLDPSTFFSETRIEGYKQGLRHSGLGDDPSMVLIGNRNAAEAKAVVEARLGQPNPPDGFLAGNNEMALGVVRALLATDVRVPVASFDTLEFAGVLPMPFVTVVNDPVWMGETAAAMLISRIQGGAGPAQRVVLTPRIEVTRPPM